MSIRSAIDDKLKAFENPFEPFNVITISRSAVLHNFDYFSSLQPVHPLRPESFVIPVLKSNAYGHGIIEIATILKSRDFPYIAVDGFFESLAIHSVSEQKVLVMGAIRPENFAGMDFKRLAIVVHDLATVEALGCLRKKIKVHVELETGMNRHGVSAKTLPAFLTKLAKYQLLDVEGVMTHLADADNPEDTMFNDEQAERFDTAVEEILKAGHHPKYIHIAQSAGSTKVISRHANTLRVGIALYGINPLEPQDKNFKKLNELKLALQLTSTITKIVELHAGDTVSYGRTYTADKATIIGVLPLGYYEGIPRALSNVGAVQYGKEYLPIVGRVCMNHTMVDISTSKAQVGDEVVVYNSDRNSKAGIDTVCRKHCLFNYGLLVGLNQNIRRKIVE